MPVVCCFWLHEINLIALYVLRFMRIPVRYGHKLYRRYRARIRVFCFFFFFRKRGKITPWSVSCVFPPYLTFLLSPLSLDKRGGWCKRFIRPRLCGTRNWTRRNYIPVPVPGRALEQIQPWRWEPANEKTETQRWKGPKLYRWCCTRRKMHRP